MFFSLSFPPPPSPTLFPYTTLFRSGPVLFQLPPNFRKAADRLGDLLAQLPPGLRAAFEFRHARDRKSTRLNSSHVAISYAVFCLKKKNNRNSTINKILRN